MPEPPGIAVGDGWRAWTDAVVNDVGTREAAVIVGHSSAGPLLPVIASKVVSPPSQLVFVDAGLPPVSGDATLVPDQFLGALRTLAHNGVLPKWSEWFGPTAMAQLIPEEDHRAAVVAELLEVPLSFFDATVPLPEGWTAPQVVRSFYRASRIGQTRPRRRREDGPRPSFPALTWTSSCTLPRSPTLSHTSHTAKAPRRGLAQPRVST